MATFDLKGLPELAAIEYPGPVKPTSLNKALKSIGGLSHVSEVLSSPVDGSRNIELSLNTKNAFSHPLPAHVSETGNVLMRVVKRRRKQPKLDEHGAVVEEGVFSVQAVGMVSKTVRFRALADFQAKVNLEDPITSLSESVRKMDVEAIKAFSWPEPNEDFTKDSFLPPPAFTRHIAPQFYDYRPAHGTGRGVGHYPAPEGEVGEPYDRMVNFTRWKGRAVQSIKMEDPDVPAQPEASLVKELEKETKGQPNATTKKLLACFEKRPMWTRVALLNQLTPDEKRVVANQKQTLPLISYTFANGPFRDLAVKFGYDPRKDPESRLYQHVTLRNVANVRTKASTSTRAPAASAKGKEKEVVVEGDPMRSHIFDGETMHSKIANFQLCDITDPLIRSHVEAKEGILKACDPQHGWWNPNYIEQIRQILRRKVLGILAGRFTSDEDCADLLGDPTPQEPEPSSKGRKKATKSRSRSRSASSSAGSQASGAEALEAMDEDEPAPGSGSEAGSDAGTEGGETTAGTKKGKAGGGRFSKSRKSTQGLPWASRAKRNRGAKKRVETEEERGMRLRRAIGIASGEQAASSSAGASDRDEEQEQDDEDEQDDDDDYAMNN